jgi:hypothetical protein
MEGARRVAESAAGSLIWRPGFGNRRGCRDGFAQRLP